MYVLCWATPKYLVIFNIRLPRTRSLGCARDDFRPWGSTSSPLMCSPIYRLIVPILRGTVSR